MKIEISERSKFIFQGRIEKQARKNLPIISSMEAKEYLEKGYDGYLAYLVDNISKTRLEEIQGVKEYPNIFLEKLSGLPPK